MPPLVDYTDSDSDSESASGAPEAVPEKSKKAEEQKKEKVSDLPPLPSKFHDVYTTAPRRSTSDDPSLHEGRKRQTPHKQGTWPTHVYIEWHCDSIEHNTISRFVAKAGQAAVKVSPTFKLNTHLTSDLGSDLPLHLSLSRPNTLETEQKVRFMDLLESAIENSGIRRFSIKFTGFEWVRNQNATRWFLVMKAAAATVKKDELIKLLLGCNRVFEVFNQPGLDGLGSSGFHVSIAWTLEEPTKELKTAVERALESELSALSSLALYADVVKVKMGNAVKIINI
ncbi:hypothetical protein BJ508DRAFT_360956 [Ascobolus immersus RN42]|uniref:U6 snRNA phosphodiesterase n=1 Tax=Ascobolus immersus RN42 TaxID=1160509 RepID=A0A3N4IDF6_ASCIM|nr:hypothetical protein BJ508DRAFT_360956 [Ascobolus immersus RN42]